MIDKIIEELEENAFEVDTRDYGRLDVIDIECAIEIVKKHENDGWVSVDEKLPSLDTRILVTFETNLGSVGIEDCWYSAYDRRFKTYNDFDNIPNGIKIIAWKPLPQPYKGE